ncbi:MAG: hypothetical protein KAI81_01420, partial [Candidatus Marinimicrobia bacterium]|nr:hypothetical protein [Candidatus Neomarinimicrobiota bacterium]
NSDYPQAQFYIRMGNISGETLNDYYEITTPIYSGWDEKNWINLQFEDITGLKNEVVTDISRNIVVSPDGSEIELYLVDEHGERTGRKYKVVGAPSFSRINYFVIGILNDQEKDYNGEIWINEFRVSDPLREKGIAFRGAVDLKIAGLTSFNINGNYRDASFHQVNQQHATTRSTDALLDKTSVNMAMGLSPHKLFPKKWGIAIPMSFNFSEKKDVPIYHPGSDILLGEHVPDSLINKSTSLGLKTSFRKSSKSDFWLTKYTVDKLGVNYSAANSISSNKNIKESSRKSYKGGISYGLNIPKGNGISYLKWIPFYGKNLEEKKIYFKPSKFSYSVNMSEESKFNQPRIGSSTSTYKLNMSQAASVSYSPLDNFTTSFKRNSSNNLDSLRYRKSDILKNFDTGFTLNESENYSASFTPKIGKFFAPKLSYSSAFKVSHRMDLPYSSASNGRNINGNFTLDPSKILAAFSKKDDKKKGKKGTSPRPKAKPKAKPKKQDSDPKKTEQKENFSIFSFLSSGIKKIQPISFTISENKNISNQGIMLGADSSYVRAPVKLLYRMGFSESPADSIATEVVGNNATSLSHKNSLSIRSGIKFTPSLTSTLNFKYDLSESNNGTNLTLNTTRGFLPLGETGSDGFPMANWSVKWSGLNKVKFIKKYVKNLSFDHAFSGQEKIAMQNGEVKSFSYSRNFQPLLGMSIQFKGNFRAEARYTTNEDIVNQNTDTRKTKSDNGTFSMNYSKKGGMNIPLPFFEDLNMQNSINFSLTFNYSKRNVYLRKIEGGEFDNTDWNESWKVKPTINYQFSKNINGSMFYEYGITSTPMNPKRINRDFGLQAKIRISG